MLFNELRQYTSFFNYLFLFKKKSLLDSMKDLNTDDWDKVKKMQKMWIGDCSGCFIDFVIKVITETDDIFELEREVFIIKVNL